MFFDPSKTGLILLGASKFPNFVAYDDPEVRSREVFLGARNAIAAYFQDSHLGLALAQENVLDVFDRDEPVGDIRSEIDRFLHKITPTDSSNYPTVSSSEDRVVKDLFIYVCSHGKLDDDVFYLLLRQSKYNASHTWLKFEELMTAIAETYHGRVYYIVDCCYSGVIHRKSMDYIEQMKLTPEDIAYISNMDMTLLPRAGATIITANNSTSIGTVIADDQLPGIDTPLFTHVLLDVLRNGVPPPSRYSLTIEHLCAETRERLPKLIAQLNRGLAVSGSDRCISPVQEASQTPEYSNRPVLKKETDNVLSTIGIFPNNHESHALALDMSRRTKLSYWRGRQQYETIEKLETEKRNFIATTEELESSNQDLLAQNQLLIAQEALMGDKIRTLSAANKQLEDAKQTLKEDKTRLHAEFQSLGATNKQLEETKRSLSEGETRWKEKAQELSAGNEVLDRKIQELDHRNTVLEASNRTLRRRAWLCGILTSGLVVLLALAWRAGFGKEW